MSLFTLFSGRHIFLPQLRHWTFFSGYINWHRSNENIKIYDIGYWYWVINRLNGWMRNATSCENWDKVAWPLLVMRWHGLVSPVSCPLTNHRTGGCPGWRGGGGAAITLINGLLKTLNLKWLKTAAAGCWPSAIKYSPNANSWNKIYLKCFVAEQHKAWSFYTNRGDKRI